MSTAPRVERMADGRVQVRTGKVQLGQGLHTALAQIVADELGVALARVEMLPVDTAQSPDEGVTSGSLSVQDAGSALRAACAELAPGAARREWVGRSVPRGELQALFAGESGFVHDLAPEGLLHGRVLHPPQAGAQLTAFSAEAAMQSPGVRRAWRDGNLVGLVAETSAQADTALERLRPALRWSASDWPVEEGRALQALTSEARLVGERNGPDSAAPVAQSFAATYTKPWIAHASIAPSCALAFWTEGRLEVWCHSQAIFNLQRDLALAFGVDPAAVLIHHVPGAGCYGHNGADDAAFDAAWLASAEPGRTVRLQWSRADELSHAPFGPAMLVQLKAGTDEGGYITEWNHELWSPGHSGRPGRSATPALLGSWQREVAFEPPAAIDPPLSHGGGAERNAVPGYDFPTWRATAHRVQTQRRSSALRSLGAFANIFAAESFIDEIAHGTGQDPLALRERHLQHDPRALAVLRAAAERAGWADRKDAIEPDTDAENSVGHGIAVARYKGVGAWCAVVAEVVAGATLRVRRLTIAVDVGLVVNPDGVVNQIEGGAVQATSWTLLESAAPSHAGWADYPILRFSDVPAVDVVLMPSEAPSVGAGEAAQGPTAAAIANALFDAMGLRVRDLPLTPERIVAAMNA
ncbi:MAG: molybdopterin-dependent oxidoreductase [Pseudomonadota bacterium]|nr:molybdopterin-dependent oxidoreductase [Pseudomonadota bacterium]